MRGFGVLCAVLYVSVQVDILTECSHPSIIKLYRAYYYNKELWVRFMIVRASLLFAVVPRDLIGVWLYG